MSRGFVKEGDQEESPIIPPRAALPNGAINYVTPDGHTFLLAERKDLEEERAQLPTENEQQRRIDLAVINGKLDLLNERIASARVIDPINQPQDEVRFGALVTYKISPLTTLQSLKIVGVDEADVALKKIAFVAPIAVALTGTKINETVPFTLGTEVKKLEVVKITYKH